MFRKVIASCAIFALTRTEIIGVQHCIPTMTLDRFCANVTRGPFVAQQWELLDSIFAQQWS
jgi:hypothetical protein